MLRGRGLNEDLEEKKPGLCLAFKQRGLQLVIKLDIALGDILLVISLDITQIIEVIHHHPIGLSEALVA